jgi:cytochrome c-type biogenesis protein CcmH/NrfG
MFAPQTLQNAASSRLSSPCTTSAQRSRLTRLVVHSNKGFGSQQQPKKNADEEMPVQGTAGAAPPNKRAGRTKGKQQMRVGQAAAQAAAQQRAQQASSLGSLAPAISPEPTESVTEKLEFEQRLKTLREEAERKKAEVRAARGGTGNILDKGPKYDDPPPLTSTLFMGGQDNKNPAADKEYSGSSFGPSQIGLGAVSLALVGVFLVANGGSELGYAAKRPSAGQQTGAQTELAPEQRADIEKQLEEMNKKLDVNADDLESLEAAAVLHARLGEYSIAAEQLEKLTAAKPNDVDSLRVLAEAWSAAGEPAKATEAYRKAWKVAGENNLEILTGFASAFVDEGKPQIAVEQIRSASKSSKAKDIGEVELGLLLAKTYSQWRGHGPDAVAQYDALIEANPQDFRPPLGKALLLRDQGQEGDAQRYILQAKYLAPPSARPLVDALTAKRQ